MNNYYIKFQNKLKISFNNIPSIERKSFLNRCGIYKITNITNNKCYIGSSKNLYSRWNGHYNNVVKQKDCQVIHKAIIKHGIQNFTIEILGICPEEYLTKLEQKFTDILNPVYSIRKIVDSNKGYKLTKKQSLKHKESLKKTFSTEEFKQRKKESAIKSGLKRSGLTPEIISLVKEYRLKNYPSKYISELLNMDIKVIKKIIQKKNLRTYYLPSETGVVPFTGYKYALINVFTHEVCLYHSPKDIYTLLNISVKKFYKSLLSKRSVVNNTFSICKIKDLDERLEFLKNHSINHITGKYPGNRKGAKFSKESKNKMRESKSKLIQKIDIDQFSIIEENIISSYEQKGYRRDKIYYAIKRNISYNNYLWKFKN